MIGCNKKLYCANIEAHLKITQKSHRIVSFPRNDTVQIRKLSEVSFVDVLQNRCSYKNFSIFPGKHLYLCWSPFFIKLLYQKETLAQVFSCEYWEIFKNTFFTKPVDFFWTVMNFIFKNWIGRGYICLLLVQGVKVSEKLRSLF